MNNMPDEVRNKIEEKYQSFFWTDEQFGFTNESPVPKMQRNAATWGYSLASEEISRLKAENERLRGEVDIINARFKENMVRFYYFMNKHFIPIKESEHKYPVNFMRYGQHNGRMAQSTIEEIVKEYFESINPSHNIKKVNNGKEAKNR